MPTEVELTQSIEAEFARLEDAAALEPSTIEALGLFSTYEQAMKDYDAYLAAFAAPGRFTTTSSTG
jgi:hypothetical protein